MLVNGDLVDEGTETYFLNLSNPGNATIADNQGGGTIIDDDGAPTLSVNDVTVAEGNAGSVNATFTVSLTPASGQTVSVGYSTRERDGDLAGRLHGRRRQPRLHARPDDAARSPCRSTATCSTRSTRPSPSTSPTRSTRRSPTASGLGTITDNDPPPTLAIDNVTVTEGNSGTVNATFTVSLNTPSGRAVSVDYATADSSATAPADYTATGGTLDFAAGQTTKTVTVAVNGDLLDEINEPFVVNLSNPSNATFSDSAASGRSPTTTHCPALSIGDATVTEGDAGTVDATFTVTLTPVSGRPVSVQYATRRRQRDAPARLHGDRLDDADLPGRRDDQDDHGAGQRRPARRDRRDLHGQPLGPVVRDDHRRVRPRHDHRRRRAADARGRRRHGHRGRLRAASTRTSRSALTPVSGRQVTVQYATANGTATAPARLHRDERLAHLRRRPDDEDRHRPGQRRPARRDRRDLHPQPLRARQRDDLRRRRARHDHRRRRAAVALGRTTSPSPRATAAPSNATFTVSLDAASGQAGRPSTTRPPTARRPRRPTTRRRAARSPSRPGQTTRTVTVPVSGDLLDEIDETFTLNLSNAGQRDDRRPARPRDDHRQRRAADALGRRRDRDRGRRAAPSTRPSRSASARRAGAPSRSTTRPPTARATAPADYVGDERDARLRRRRDDEDGHRPSTATCSTRPTRPSRSTSSNATNATIADGTGVGTITDDDPLPTLSIDDVDRHRGRRRHRRRDLHRHPERGQRADGHGQLRDRQRHARPRPADYAAASGTLSFAAGETTKTITVTVNGDLLDEVDETFAVNLSNAVNATITDPHRASARSPTTTPLPTLSINDVTVTEGNRAPVNAIFTVSLSAPSGQTVTVDYATAERDGDAPGRLSAPAAGR